MQQGFLVLGLDVTRNHSFSFEKGYLSSGT